MINLDLLLRARAVVARYGEMDRSKWWNTSGQLGPHGRTALRRGLPRTHYFAQARSVFAVAAHRCTQVYDPPNAVTLWRLPESIEEEFEARWEFWLDSPGDWITFFDQLTSTIYPTLSDSLVESGVATQADVESVARIRPSAQGNFIAIPGTFTGEDQQLVALALGFARGSVNSPIVPYMKRAVA